MSAPASLVSYVFVRVTDFRPEFTDDIVPGVYSQHDTGRSCTAREGVQSRGLPNTRNESAADGAGDAPGGNGLFPSRCLVSDNGTAESVSQARPKALLTGWAITEFFVAQGGYGVLNRVLHHVLAESGRDPFAESGCAASPFVRAVS